MKRHNGYSPLERCEAKNYDHDQLLTDKHYSKVVIISTLLFYLFSVLYYICTKLDVNKQNYSSICYNMYNAVAECMQFILLIYLNIVAVSNVNENEFYTKKGRRAGVLIKRSITIE